jgi:hypothetical protein
MQAKADRVLPELAADIAALYKGLSNLQGAAHNFALMNAAAPGAAITNGSAKNYAAFLMTVKSGGIFDCSISFAFTGATAAASSTLAVTTQTNTAAIALTNTTAVGSPASGPFVATTGAGIAVTGGPFSAVTQSSEAFTTATGQTTGFFSWSGLLQNGTAQGAFTPFTVGNSVVVLFSLNAGTSDWTLSNICAKCIERAA